MSNNCDLYSLLAVSLPAKDAAITAHNTQEVKSNQTQRSNLPPDVDATIADGCVYAQQMLVLYSGLRYYSVFLSSPRQALHSKHKHLLSVLIYRIGTYRAAKNIRNVPHTYCAAANADVPTPRTKKDDLLSVPRPSCLRQSVPGMPLLDLVSRILKQNRRLSVSSPPCVLRSPCLLLQLEKGSLPTKRRDFFLFFLSYKLCFACTRLTIIWWSNPVDWANATLNSKSREIIINDMDTQP